MSSPAVTERQAAAFELESLEAELARRHLRRFVEIAWPLVEPGQSFCGNWHIDELCKLLEEVTLGKHDKVIVNVPPGCMKSLLVSVMWPAWMWASNPSLRFLSASYGAHLSIRDNVRLRDIITSPWYTTHYGHLLSGDQRAKERFSTTSSGWRVATSVGGVGTGEHPDFITIDDPLTAQQALSELERAGAIQWIDGTMSSRGVSRGRKLVIVMQRLHEQDPTGHLLAKQAGYLHVMWPMRFEPKRADPRDPRTQAGELLWPAMFPEDKVRQLELALGAYGTAGQLQQRPAPEGGGMFQREWFRRCPVSAVPATARLLRAWDTATNESGGDWTAGVKWAEADGKFYIVDVRRGRWSAADVTQIMRRIAISDGQRCRIREDQEPAAAGKAQIAARKQALVGFDFDGVLPTGDKVVRAGPLRSQAESGNVYLCEGAWNEEYLKELEVFPNGAFDDQVDASSTGFNALSLGPRPVRKRDVRWG